MSKILPKKFNRPHLTIKPYSRLPTDAAKSLSNGNGNESINQPIINESINETKNLFENIFEQLNNERPNERIFGTDMIMTYMTNDRLTAVNSSNDDLIKKILKQLSKMICDRSENVRFGTVDALNHLFSLNHTDQNDNIAKQMCAERIPEKLLEFLQKFLLPLNLNEKFLTSKNSKVSNLTIFIDTFDLLVNFCDRIPDEIVEKLINFNDWNRIVQKCLEIYYHSMNNWNHLNLLLSCIRLISLLTDEHNDFLKRFDLNESITKNLIEKLYEPQQQQQPTDDDHPPIQTGKDYLQILVLKIHFSENVNILTSNSFESKFNELITKIYSNNSIFNSKFDQFFVEIQNNDLSEEIKQLESLNPFYQELHCYLCSKQFASIWLIEMINQSSYDDQLSNNEDQDDEMMDIDNDNVVLKEFLQKFIENQSFINTIVEDLNNSINFIQNVSRMTNNHLYVQDLIESMQNYTIITLILLCNLIDFNHQNFSAENFKKLWQIIHSIIFTVNNQQAMCDIQIESINLMRQLISTIENVDNEQYSMSENDLQYLKSLLLSSSNDDNESMKINIIKIISEYLQKSATISNKSALINEWIRFLLKSISETNTNNQQSPSIVIIAEILDSIIDLLSNETLAIDCMKQDSSIYQSLLDVWKRNRRKFQQNHRNIIDDYPCISIVNENMPEFLNYLKNLM